MAKTTREDFLRVCHERTFADALNGVDQPFDDVLYLFNEEGRQRLVEEPETQDENSALAAAVKELESQPAIDDSLSSIHPHRQERLRKAVQGCFAVGCQLPIEPTIHKKDAAPLTGARPRDRGTYCERSRTAHAYRGGMVPTSPLRRSSSRP